MSVHTRKLHTNNFVEIIVQDASKTKFIIPQSAAHKVMTFLESLQINNASKDELIPADVVFRKLDEKYGKTGVTIRGLRVRDGLTQEALAQKLDIHQTHISQIENGKRVVGKKLAQKLAKIFHTDYRLFL